MTKPSPKQIKDHSTADEGGFLDAIDRRLALRKRSDELLTEIRKRVASIAITQMEIDELNSEVRSVNNMRASLREDRETVIETMKQVGLLLDHKLEWMRPLQKINPEQTNNIIPAGTVRFIEAESALTDDNHRCELPRQHKEHYLCRIMFREPLRADVSWDDIYTEIDEGEVPTESDEKKAAKKMVKDTMYRANDRFRSSFGTSQALFTWNNGVVRNL